MHADGSGGVDLAVVIHLSKYNLCICDPWSMWSLINQDLCELYMICVNYSNFYPNLVKNVDLCNCDLHNVVWVCSTQSSW